MDFEPACNCYSIGENLGDQQVLQGIIVGKNIIRVSKNVVDYLVKSAIRICLLVNVD